MLTSEELQTLTQYALAGDRIAYYNELGNAYGDLAFDVAMNSAFSGVAANVFFLDEARRQGVIITNEQLGLISQQLMLADLDARQDPKNYFGDRLRVDAISEYHAELR